ncbi:MAG: MotB family protein [Ectothiorhodospiraceae bacterium]
MLGDAQNRKKSRIVPAGAPPWMATFADLSTLLLSFFVLLLSFSEMDVHKYKQIAGSLKMAFGVQREQFAKDTPKGTSFVAREFVPGKPDPSPLDKIEQKADDLPQPYLDVQQEGMPVTTQDAVSDGNPDPSAADRKQAAENLEKIRGILAEEIRRGLVEVEQLGSRIVIRIRERGSFPSGSAKLIEPFTPVIRKIGKAIQLTDGRVIVAGHTDNVPIRTSRFRSNWELSAARAVTLVLRLEDLSDVNPKRITVEGHADTEPLVPNDTPLHRARNRRVEVILVHGNAYEKRQSVDEFLGDRQGRGGDNG